MQPLLIAVRSTKPMHLTPAIVLLNLRPKAQQGVALVVSLILLVAMTVLGVATLSGTRLNEKISSNAQQKAIAFEVAESAIAAVWDKKYLDQLLISELAGNGNNPPAILTPDTDNGIKTQYDQALKVGSVDIDGQLTVQYCGEMANVGSDRSADESSFQMVYKLMDINSQVQIGSTRAQAEHVQRGATTAAKTNRTGACPAP